VISIVGKYRTGKSFFVNRVLLDKVNQGFNVGPTIHPCTKVNEIIFNNNCLTSYYFFIKIRGFGYGAKLFLQKIQIMKE
jgi:hypothetical protein